MKNRSEQGATSSGKQTQTIIVFDNTRSQSRGQEASKHNEKPIPNLGSHHRPRKTFGF
jgi:hypothetical protein